jgi:hypothetical protein
MSLSDEATAAAIAKSEAEVRQHLDRRDALRGELAGVELALTRIAEWRASLLDPETAETAAAPPEPVAAS